MHSDGTTTDSSSSGTLQVAYLARVAVDAGHNGVAKLAVLAPLVEGLHDDSLAAGVAPSQQHHNLARLDAAGCIQFRSVRRYTREVSRGTHTGRG